MKTTITIIVTLALLAATSIASAKSQGRFLKYTQYTDKEILIESTKGVKVLFTAVENNEVKVTYFNSNEAVNLTSASNREVIKGLCGSIYVEELEELMQIAIAESNIVIEINKSKFDFNFTEKAQETGLDFEEQLAELAK